MRKKKKMNAFAFFKHSSIKPFNIPKDSKSTAWQQLCTLVRIRKPQKSWQSKMFFVLL